MTKGDIHEGDPRQDHRDQQQRGGDQLGDPRASSGRLMRVRLVMRAVNNRARAVHRRPTMMRTVIGGAVFDTRWRPLARIARARAIRARGLQRVSKTAPPITVRIMVGLRCTARARLFTARITSRTRISLPLLARGSPS